MDNRYEAFVMADPVFYDAPHSQPGGETFRIAERPPPDGWRRSPQDDWLVFQPAGVTVPAQGWKIHVSACLDSGVANADRILDAVWDYCVPRRIEFKVLRSPAALLARLSKYAPRGYSGKLVTIYPAELAACETILRELGGILDGEPNPYILSDLRWGKGPLFVRYGAFRNRYTVDDRGDVVPAIEDGSGKLVPDRRGPVFQTPPWAELPDFLAPQLAARNDVTVDSLPYTVERVLHFSNGGGIYAGRDRRTGEPVVLKEARPHCGLDARRHDAVQRLEREHAILQWLAGIPGVPREQGLLSLGEHRFLAMERIDGAVLSQAIVARYPLIDPAADRDEYARYTDWAVGIYEQVEATVAAMHERGVVYGDLHLFNVMLREDGTVALLDFEVAAPVDEATRPGLGNQGFAPPLGTTGFEIDRYGLACLRLAMFLPMTNLLWLHRPKAHHYARLIGDHFPVSPDYLRKAVELIAPGEPEPPIPIEPDTGQWPALRERLTRAILASATPDRDDRLFPGDPEQFTVGGLGLAHGAAGVLYALATTGAGRYPDLEQWLLDRATNPPSGTRPGLFDGLHGVAYAFDQLGHRQAALDVVGICLQEDWQSLGLDLAGGLAGVGLNLLYLADRTGEPALRIAAHRAAELVAERIVPPEPGDEPLVSGREQGYSGLMRGQSGPALLMLRAYDDTGDTGYLDRAAEAIRYDLRRCLVRDSGALEVNEGWRTMPYLDVGSAGIGLVLDEYLARRPDDQFAAASGGVLLAASAEMYILPGLFSGRAGILLYLAGRSPSLSTDPLVARQVRGLAWHALPFGDAREPNQHHGGDAREPNQHHGGDAREPDRTHGHGIAFPGTGLLRLSMDLATGTAGVLLALGAALHDPPVSAPLLAPMVSAPGSPRADTMARADTPRAGASLAGPRPAAVPAPAPTGAGS